MKPKRIEKVIIAKAFVGHMTILTLNFRLPAARPMGIKLLYLEAIHSEEIGHSNFNKLIYDTYRNIVGSLLMHQQKHSRLSVENKFRYLNEQVFEGHTVAM